MRSARGAVALAAVVLGAGAPAASADSWYAGDGHVHTCYSHDAFCPPGDDNTGAEVFQALRRAAQRPGPCRMVRARPACRGAAPRARPLADRRPASARAVRVRSGALRRGRAFPCADAA